MSSPMPTADAARAFLNDNTSVNTVNVHHRIGRPSRLTFKFKPNGKTYAYEIDDDVPDGKNLIPELRQLLASIDSTHAERGTRAVRNLSTPGSRLRFAREEKTLTRPKLEKMTGVPTEKIKWLETTPGTDITDLLTQAEIASLAHVCEVAVDWLVIGPPPLTPEPPMTPEETPPPVDTPPTETDYAAIGVRLKQARLVRGWTQGKLAAAIGYGPNSVWMAENGKRNGLFKQLETLAHILKCDADWLITGTGVAPRDKLTKRPRTSAISAD